MDVARDAIPERGRPFLPLFLVYDVGQMLIQFLFIPTILEFMDSEPLQTA